MSFEEEPTQQLRRTPPPPPPPMPGPLDLTSPATSQPDTTDVLSIDELLGPAGTPSGVDAGSPTAAAPTPAGGPVAVTSIRSEQPATSTAPVEALPAQSLGGDGPAGSSLAQRLRRDTRTALDGARTRGRTWLQTGDNLLIALTLVVGLLLVIVIAAV